jgi:hypothetical protein
MTVGRIAGVLSLMAFVAGVLIWLRSEEIRTAVNIQRLHHEEIAIRREWWSKQLELARLKSPGAIADRVAPMRLEVIPPHREDPMGEDHVWAPIDD